MNNDRTDDPDVTAAMQRLEMRELLDRSSLGSTEAKRLISLAGNKNATYSVAEIHGEDGSRASVNLNDGARQLIELEAEDDDIKVWLTLTHEAARELGEALIDAADYAVDHDPEESEDV